MAAQVKKITLGIDVSKDTLDVYQWDSEQHQQLVNQPKTIAKFLNSLYGPVEIAIEPTSNYHLAFIEQAHALGHEIFLVNTRQLAHYRKAVGERNKTDATDAWLLARYLDRERSELHVFRPPERLAQQLWTVIKRRALVVETHKQLRQSLATIKLSAKSAYRELNRLIERMEIRIIKLIDQLGWSDDYRRCLSIPGIGPINAAALVAAYNRGAFSGANAFIAYLGFDVRIRESGKFKGKRKLTKYGESELRRLLYCAAKPSRCYLPFDQYYQSQLAKGLPKIAANVILARKLARIAFALLRNQSTFTKLPVIT